MKNVLSLIFFAFLLTSCANTPQLVNDHNVATLTDSPAIQFDTSGWSYTNTTNPFLLTPDYLTNAMLGVSRLKPGETLLNNGPTIPSKLYTETIAELLKQKLAGKENLSLSLRPINGKSVVVATYESDSKKGIEYAFPLAGQLIHVLLLASPGAYYQQGKVVSEKLVGSIRQYVPKT